MNADDDFAPELRTTHDRPMTFLDKIEILLERKGWPQYRLEREAGLAMNRISRWKAGVGKGPSVDEGIRIARILGVSLDDLADESRDIPEPSPIGKKSAVLAGDAIPSAEEILLTVYRGLGIGLEEAIRRLSNPSGPIIDVERPRKRPG